jgi:multiple sugar transport system ATP-binding protein
MAALQLKQVAKRYGATTVIHRVDLEVKDGEFVVFVGPSGCGKSTLLRMIAGLESVSEGDILIDGANVNKVSAAERGLAMVFQSYALYPHMTVHQNLAFGLENLRTPRAQIETKVRDAAQMLRLDQLLERRPTQLSGGQRQRVAIGRAIVRDPTIFLFDEPLSNLDAELRVQMRAEITALHARLGTTMIYVTHDQVEAMTMADRIVVLRGGRVEQIGAPLDLYNRPDNRFVAGFIGSPQMNFLAGRIASLQSDGARVALDAAPQANSGAAVPLRGSGAPNQRILIGIRPEHVSLGAAAAGSLQVTVRIDRVEQLGAASFLYCSLASGEQLTVHALGQVRYANGDQVAVNLPVSDIHVFDATDADTAVALR